MNVVLPCGKKLDLTVEETHGWPINMLVCHCTTYGRVPNGRMTIDRLVRLKRKNPQAFGRAASGAIIYEFRSISYPFD